MQNEKSCAICGRDINVPSPRTEEILEVAQNAGLLEQIAIVHPEPSAELCDGTLAHEACNEIRSFLNSLGTPPEIVELRLKGYRAGKPFEAYMNWPHGLEAPSVNSYRVLTAVFSVMFGFQENWLKGNILPGECFGLPKPIVSVMSVQDLSMEESSLARWYAEMAQVTLSHAVILWSDAHRWGNPCGTDQEMFLTKHSYDPDQWQDEVGYFKGKRNKAIGHIATCNWDAQNTHRHYQPYPGWADDWKRFRELLGHGIDLCTQDIDDKLAIGGSELNGYPLRRGGGGDPIQPGVDLMNTLGLPRTTGVGERPPRQGPYPFRHDGTKWVEEKPDMGQK